MSSHCCSVKGCTANHNNLTKVRKKQASPHSNTRGKTACTTTNNDRTTSTDNKWYLPAALFTSLAAGLLGIIYYAFTGQPKPPSQPVTT